jgi:hypothetical protein
VRQEICRTLLKMQEMGSTFTSQIQSLIDEQVCKSQAE